jgi:hypothetical protein
MDLFFLFQKLSDPVHYAMELGLIHNQMICKCGKSMKLAVSSEKIDCVVWRCKCTNKASIKKNSFWNEQKECHLELKKVILLIYLWSFKIPITVATQFSGVSSKTAQDIYQMMRDLCSEELSDDWIKLGGENKTVEIDETFLLKKRKYNRGRIVERKRDVFGIVERESGKANLEFINGKARDDLIPIIEDMVLKGTTICSDSLSTYLCLENCGYKHKRVNHSIGEYVNKDDKENHVNSIEGLWGNLKTHLRSMRGTTDELLSSHIDEFSWRLRNKNAFESICKLINKHLK